MNLLLNKRRRIGACYMALFALLIHTSPAQAEIPPETKWMQDKKWGISHHYLAGGKLNNAYFNITDYTAWNDYVNDFDVNDYADKVAKAGVGYVIFTITQNRGYLATTSTVYDKHAPPCTTALKASGCRNQSGANRADYTPTRDLMLDLATALESKGIALIAYIPVHPPRLWTGQVKPVQAPDWWTKEFFSEKATDWGTKVAGWWIDGWFDFKDSEPPHFLIARKIHESILSGNPKAIISFNNASNGFGTFRANTPYDNVTAGESNVLLPVPDDGETTGYGGKEALWHGFTYLQGEDETFKGWGQVKNNLRFGDNDVANRVKAIADVGGVSTWDLGINPSGKIPLSGLKQIQAIGNKTGTTSDTTYSGLQLINDDNALIHYSGSWSHSTGRGTGAYKQDVHYATDNGAYMEYQFHGKSIVYATSLAHDQGKIEIYLDGISQGLYSTQDTNKRMVQQIIFEKHNLRDGLHTFKAVKRSGSFMLVDMVASRPNTLSKFNNSESSTAVGYRTANNRSDRYGTWSRSTGRGVGDYLDDVSYTTTNNAAMHFAFTGTTFRYIAPLSHDQGKVEVIIDGVSHGNVNTYSPTRKVQRYVFSVDWLSPGGHTVQLKKKSGTYGVVDAVEYGTDGLKASRHNDTEVSRFGSGWGRSTGRGWGDYWDDVYYTSTNGSYFTYTFTGTAISVFGPKNSDQGDIEIYLDGVYQGRHNMHAYHMQAQEIMFSKGGLANTSHTVKIVKRSGTYMVVDGVEYLYQP